MVNSIHPTRKRETMAVKKNKHICDLPPSDTTCLPKLPPNASVISKIYREFRKLFLLNINHFKCKRYFPNKPMMMEEKRRHIATNPWVIHPMSSLSLVTHLTFFLTWSYVLIARPLMVFSNDFSSTYRLILTYVIVPVQLMVIALLLNCGYLDLETYQVVTQSRKVVTTYLKTYFIFDAVSSFFLLEIMNVLTNAGYVTCSMNTIDQSYCFETVFVISIAAGFVRVGTLQSYLKEVLTFFDVGKPVRTSMMYVMKTFYYLHAIAFLLYLIPYLMYRGNWPHESWLAKEGLRHDNPMYTQYFECLIMAACTFFGVAYRTNIHRIEEQIALSLVKVIGRLYTLYLVADILDLFVVVDLSESIYEKRMAILKEYMIATNLPQALRNKLMLYFKYKYQRRYFKEQAIASSLSERLRAEMFFYTAQNAISKVEFFKRLPSAVVTDIISTMHTKIYSPAEVIFDAGSEVNYVFFISTGTVKLVGETGRELCHLEDGDTFGGDCLVVKQQQFTVETVETTEVFAISKRQLLKFLSEYSEVRGGFVKSVKTQMQNLNKIEARLGKSGKAVLKELEKGTLLEMPTKRLLER